jgi:hypothetical protein
MKENYIRRELQNYGLRGRESEERPVKGWTKGDFNGDEADHLFLFLFLELYNLAI